MYTSHVKKGKFFIVNGSNERTAMTVTKFLGRGGGRKLSVSSLIIYYDARKDYIFHWPVDEK